MFPSSERQAPQPRRSHTRNLGARSTKRHENPASGLFRIAIHDRHHAVVKLGFPVFCALAHALESYRADALGVKPLQDYHAELAAGAALA